MRYFVKFFPSWGRGLFSLLREFLLVRKLDLETLNKLLKLTESWNQINLFYRRTLTFHTDFQRNIFGSIINIFDGWI